MKKWLIALIILVIIGVFVCVIWALTLNNSALSNVKVICEIDPQTNLTSPINCNLTLIENPKQYYNLLKQSYSSNNSLNSIYSSAKFGNVSCIILPGSPGNANDTHSCQTSIPMDSIDKEIIRYSLTNTDNAFKGIRCDSVVPSTSTDSIIVFCSRHCANINIKPVSCTYIITENGSVVVTLNQSRMDSSDLLIGLNYLFYFDFFTSSQGDYSMIKPNSSSLQWIEHPFEITKSTEDLPGNYENKSVQIYIAESSGTTPGATIKVTPFTFTPSYVKVQPVTKELICGVVNNPYVEVNCTLANT